jgi:hypothetical protein
MTYKVYWRDTKSGDKAWKLSASTKKPVTLEEAQAIFNRYVNEHECEAKIKVVAK